jgi:threo-3-hydroxy-L-aspartate ammonia-lyase
MAPVSWNMALMAATPPLTFEDVQTAAQRLRGVVERTPVVRSEALDAQAGNQLYIKCENLQRIGAFKLRGAYNRMAQLEAHERERGVVAFSSGNHAQGVALAAQMLGIAATIVMPADAPLTKLNATRGYGANVITYDRARENRELIAGEIAARTHATLVPPFDDYRIMAGQGTTALELLEDVPDLDALLVPLGGGGLLAGCAVASKHLRPQLLLFGVEPETGNDWQLSWQRGEPQHIEPPRSIADGLCATTPGALTWPIVRALADGVLTVSDAQLRAAMRALLECTRLTVEPSGAAGLAAALFEKTPLRGKKVGVILSGGNVDADTFARLISGAA